MFKKYDLECFECWKERRVSKDKDKAMNRWDRSPITVRLGLLHDSNATTDYYVII